MKKISVRDFEPKILIKGVHRINFEKKLVEGKLILFLMKKYIHVVNLKKGKKIYVTILLFILYLI